MFEMFTVKIILILLKYLFIVFSKWQQINILQSWTEVCHQIFAVWEEQTKWNLQNVWCLQKSMFLSKNLYK